MTKAIPQPRIFLVTYCSSARRPRKVSVWVKVPYGGVFGMADSLTRAMLTNQIRWFRIDVARPGDITPDVRATLTRWTDALPHTSSTTAVEWTR